MSMRLLNLKFERESYGLEKSKKRIREVALGCNKGGTVCNAPKYTLVVFDMFRVFCRHKLKFS